MSSISSLSIKPKRRETLPAQLFIQLGLGIFLSTFGDCLLYTVLPQETYASQVGISLGMVGFVLGINRLTRLISNRPIGTLYDRMPRRKIMLPSVFLSIIAGLFYLFSRGPVLIILGRIIWGVAWSCMWIGAITMTMDISTGENRGKMSSILSVVTTLAIALGSFFSGWLCDQYGFHTSLWISIGLCLINTFLWVFFLPETFCYKTNPDANAPKTEQPLSAEQKVKTILIASALFVVCFSYNGAIFSTTVLWLNQYFGVGAWWRGIFLPAATLAGYLGALRTCVGAVSAPVVGALSDKNQNRKPFVIICLLLAGCGTFLLPSSSFLVSLVSILIGSFAAGGISTVVYAWIGDMTQPGNKGKAVGLANNLADLGSALGPILTLNLIPVFGLFNIYAGLGFLFIFAIFIISKV